MEKLFITYIFYIVSCLLMSTQSFSRNLQFSHFVEGYLFDFPPELALFVDNTGNIIDPYLANRGHSASVGFGGSGDFNIRVQCEPPLTLRSGGCACPNRGSYIRTRNWCISREGIITADGIIDDNTNVGNPGDQLYTIKDEVCPLNLRRDGLYPKTIVDLNNFFRNYDGEQNNIQNPKWGSTNSPLERKINAYRDRISEPPTYLPNPRQVSNTIGSAVSTFNNRLGCSMAFVIFGQFLDHDIDLTQAQHPQQHSNVEYLNIRIPQNDRFFYNIPEMEFTRSQHLNNSSGPREFPNMITTWIDGSQIYGSDPLTNCMLRSFEGGKLKTSRGNLLPLINGELRAGDIRAIENVVLASFHTIFMREHNRLCDQITYKFPDLNDEEIFQTARNYVIGLLQKLVFKDFLPILLGDSYDLEIGRYRGYNPNTNPTLSIQFTTAAFRIGHSLLSPKFARVDQYQRKIGEFDLDELFFASRYITSSNIDDIMRGLPRTPMKQRSSQIINEVRNLLVLDPQRRQVKLDLFSLNLQRGRDHGIGSYNDLRRKQGLYPISDFYDILPPTYQGRNFAQKLFQLYKSPQDLDLWMGIISQRPVRNGVLGELGVKIIGQAFRNIRDGDRFWYQNSQYYPYWITRQIQETSLSDIISRNTNAKQLPRNMFLLSQ